MRRSSNHMLQSQTSEPLIVVEDEYAEYEEASDNVPMSRQSSEDEQAMNPYLLSPYAREIRKHSLPTPQCSGITASQVRRLSERSETAGPGPRQAEFLATLSTAPAPTPGGRRHSVVTISKVPSTIFGRNRRESMAAFSPGAGFPGRVLPNRRESIACPPSTEPRGSVHNLQLDIMDDILQARKVRMKLWNTSGERFCEVQPLDETGASSVQRYSNSSSRRYSDFVGTTLPPIPSSNKRRASELPPPSTSCSTSGSSKLPSSGIVCSNTDLISILSLSTSATEINQTESGQSSKSDAKSVNLDQKRSRLKSNRSNSFDVSILHAVSQESDSKDNASPAPSNWFVKRHQPLSVKSEAPKKPAPKVSFAKDVPKEGLKEGPSKSKKVVETEPGKVMWDNRSGSLVDAHALGSAIEVFLRHGSPDSSNSPPSVSPNKSNKSPNKSQSGRNKTSWFSNKGEEDSTETCDSSICSTLKDLFVK